MDCPKCRTPQSDAQPFCAQCGASLQPAAPSSAAADVSTRFAPYKPDALETGTTFAGRYQIIEELGRGGMGRVYKVVDKEVHAKIALKLIRPDIAFDQATIERFRQELKTAREISHKNICRLHDLGRDGDTYFLTMEYVSGQDLKSMIAQSGQLAVGTAISIAKQVCEGLAEAHRLGVIHRDLKPQNIQIDKGGQAKIMDFGIARSVVAKGITDGGMAIGTPQYMSPEQAEAKGVDARSDLYALGVILYEMLTGRVPFDADTPLAVAMKHKLEAPRDPLELNAAIPADLGRLILKCLEKDKERRYQSASEVHADLVRIEHGLPTSAQVVPQPPPSTPPGVRPQTPRLGSDPHFRQWRVPALIVVALLLIAFGAWRFWPRSSTAVAPAGPMSRPTLAVLYFENISDDPTLNTWRTGLPELLITSLSQSRLLNVVSSDTIFSILKKLNLADAKRFSAEDLAGVAKEGHAQYLLTGSVMKAGQRTVITARLQKVATGGVIRSATMECPKDEEILSKVDALANGIKADLNLSPQAIAGDSSQPLDQVLTSSPEALKYYTEARRHHLNTAPREAILLYQRAVEADPGFAMAYRGLASAYSNIGEQVKRAAAARTALHLSDRLPERFRYQVQVTAYLSSMATYPQVVDAGNKLLAKYPDDDIALNFLSQVSCAVGNYERCAELREAAARISPAFLPTNALAFADARLGLYDKRKSILDAYIERDPNNAQAHVALGQGYLITGLFAEAQRESDKALLLDPRGSEAVLFKGDVAYLRGDLAPAEHEYLALMDLAQTESDRRTARVRLGWLHLTQGRLEQARRQAKDSSAGGTTNEWLGWVELEAGRPDLAVKTFQSRLADPAVASEPAVALYALSGLGLSLVAIDDVSRAWKTLDDLKAFPEGMFVKLKARLSLQQEGAVAARRGEARAAIADLERAVAMLPYQALNYSASGRFSDEHAGVLDLWKDADKGLLEIADAKKRLGR